METITYLNLKVEGTPITRVLTMDIENGIDDRGNVYRGRRIFYFSAFNAADIQHIVDERQ